ncbi:hypothetical protein ACFV27_01635 [Streptomyces antimycoticus]|uniref:Secreted protein n=2 Tax=Streptomyces violaceusniger group TaxID=2839105 RepID=A0ABD5JEY0_9ACTN|nr:hypothetical protein [Streptomyces violaceusniger]KUL45809.1 hypothetical protein ADL28_36490 [Streptomyces violaceusniger]MEE4586203.1 hypothetical protein [Streptomyces sp. DSM 41602]
MRPAPRTIPPVGHWLAGTLVVLLAVLLALVPADTARAASAPAPHPAPAATSAERTDTAPHADDAWAAARAVQARARHDHLGERPSLPDHHATHARGTDTGPAVGTRTAGPCACAPVPSGRWAQQRGRAPPAYPGT